MATKYVSVAGIEVERTLYEFINAEALPNTGVEVRGFWRGLAELLHEFAPRNAALLQRRDQLQGQLDRWHQGHPGPITDPDQYEGFLRAIGYLETEGDPFVIETESVDAEIGQIAGPQLVVPVDNARYALNAANARWGSLYDALYGTDVIDEEQGAARATHYNPIRGARVIRFVRDFLDTHFPLVQGSHKDVTRYRLGDSGLMPELSNAASSCLQAPEAFVGFQGEPRDPTAILLRRHGLHVELRIDRSGQVGRLDTAGVDDVVLESAVTTIQDCEDSVAAVDAQDKVRVYRNWLGLMQGTLQASFEKGAHTVRRELQPDRRYQTGSGQALTLPGRSLMLVRNVGPFMATDAVTIAGAAVPETILDAALTALIGMHDLLGNGRYRNSRRGSIYIVKPKMHGSEEVAFADALFGRVEGLLNLPPCTLKMGIMDEERRTSVNLRECIRAARRRVAFINTGFLDRTGDEIHTCMYGGAVTRKSELRTAVWLGAYERNNVQVGLRCGLPGKAQIGKGMWAAPDQMAAMLTSKVAHPLAGASTAWVPSPTAATLHALHYHQVDVAAKQAELKADARSTMRDMLTAPIVAHPDWGAAQVEEELRNNSQSILGYVVRWIDFGIGCSKVPDYYNVMLMEDRATLRISSQHLANWLLHGICTRVQLEETMRRMARIVDQQNAGDPSYQAMSANFDDNLAFAAARELVFQGLAQPNGYTEHILHRYRARRKAATTARAGAAQSADGVASTG